MSILLNATARSSSKEDIASRLVIIQRIITFHNMLSSSNIPLSDCKKEKRTKMKRFAPVAAAEVLASCVSGETKSSSESELVLLTSSTTSLFGSICRKLRHWNVRCPAATLWKTLFNNSQNHGINAIKKLFQSDSYNHLYLSFTLCNKFTFTWHKSATYSTSSPEKLIKYQFQMC